VYRSQVIDVFFQRSIMADFGRARGRVSNDLLGAFETGSDVTSLLSYHDFLFLFP
jgi:hypothetical protein